MDRSPAEVVATLLDEEVYLCSERTMYRVLASEVPVQERRSAAHPSRYKKPEFNQVWSWDITRLLGPRSGALLPLRHHGHLQPLRRGLDGGGPGELGPGRPVDPAELRKHGVQPRVLTLHSDRGAPMTSQCTAQLLADLGVTRSLSRPQVSDDNPFSEAQFTLEVPSLVSRTVRGSGPSQDVLSTSRWYNGAPPAASRC